MKPYKEYSGIDIAIREVCALDRQESRVRIFWRRRVVA